MTNIFLSVRVKNLCAGGVQDCEKSVSRHIQERPQPSASAALRAAATYLEAHPTTVSELRDLSRKPNHSYRYGLQGAPPTASAATLYYITTLNWAQPWAQLSVILSLFLKIDLLVKICILKASETYVWECLSVNGKHAKEKARRFVKLGIGWLTVKYCLNIEGRGRCEITIRVIGCAVRAACVGPGSAGQAFAFPSVTPPPRIRIFATHIAHFLGNAPEKSVPERPPG